VQDHLGRRTHEIEFASRPARYIGETVGIRLHPEARAGKVRDAFGFYFLYVTASMIRSMELYVGEFMDCSLEHGSSIEPRMDADAASSIVGETIGFAAILTAQGEMPRLNGPETGFNEALIAVLGQYLREHLG